MLISRGRACAVLRNGCRNVHFVTAADLVRGDQKLHRGRYEHATVESDEEWDPSVYKVHILSIVCAPNEGASSPLPRVYTRRPPHALTRDFRALSRACDSDRRIKLRFGSRLRFDCSPVSVDGRGSGLQDAGKQRQLDCCHETWQVCPKMNPL